MKKAVLLGAFSGAIIAFVWSTVSWMVLPWHETTFKSFSNSAQVASALKRNALEKGIYLLPPCCDGDTEQYKERYAHGPIVFASVDPHGRPFNMINNLIIHFLSLFVAAGLISYIVAQLKSKYGQRFFAVFLIGLIVSWLIAVPNWNWWNFPTEFSFVSFFDSLITWGLAAFVIAKFAHVPTKARKSRK